MHSGFAFFSYNVSINYKTYFTHDLKKCKKPNRVTVRTVEWSGCKQEHHMLPASEHTSSVHTISLLGFTRLIKLAGGEEETFPNLLGKLCQDLTFWLRALWLCHTTSTPCAPPALAIMCLESDPAFPAVALVSAGDKWGLLLTCSLLCGLLFSFALKKSQWWYGTEAGLCTCTISTVFVI